MGGWERRMREGREENEGGEQENEGGGGEGSLRCRRKFPCK